MIDLPKIKNDFGRITMVENKPSFPFDVKRIFYLYGITKGESRGSHAHKKCHQFLVAIAGSFNVQLDDGNSHKTVLLSQSNKGIHVPPGIWASETDFSVGATCLVLASHIYEEQDYIRDYNEFKKLKK